MKKKILLSIQGQFYFDKAMIYISNLSKDYLIFVIVKETYSSGNIKENLEKFKKSGIIIDYLITDKLIFKNNILKNYFFINKIINQLKGKNLQQFDFYFTDSTGLIFDKILQNFLKEEIVVIINGYNAFLYLDRNLEEQVKFYNYYYNSNHKLEKRVKKKFINILKTKKPIHYLIYLKSRINIFFRKITRFYLYFIIPKLLFIKTLSPTRLEEKCLWSEKIEYLICFENYIASFYKKKFPQLKVFLSENLSKKICKCEKTRKSGALFLVSGFGEVEYLDDKYLEELLISILTSLKYLETSKIVLRHHPFKNYNKWVPSLQKLLKDKGIDTDIDYAKKHLTEVACDYIGIIGMPSLGLRDVTMMCGNKTKVICFENLSRVRYPFPKGVIFQDEVLWLNDKNQVSKVTGSYVLEENNINNINNIFKSIELKK